MPENPKLAELHKMLLSGGAKVPQDYAEFETKLKASPEKQAQLHGMLLKGGAKIPQDVTEFSAKLGLTDVKKKDVSVLVPSGDGLPSPSSKPTTAEVPASVAAPQPEPPALNPFQEAFKDKPKQGEAARGYGQYLSQNIADFEYNPGYDGEGNLVLGFQQGKKVTEEMAANMGLEPMDAGVKQLVKEAGTTHQIRGAGGSWEPISIQDNVVNSATNFYHGMNSSVAAADLMIKNLERQGYEKAYELTGAEGLKQLRDEAAARMGVDKEIIDEAEKNFKPTTSLTGAIKNGDAASIAGALAGTLVETAGSGLTAYATGGASPFIQGIGSSYLEANRGEDGELDMERIQQGRDKVVIPVIAGTIQGVLEKAGLDKIGRNFIQKAPAGVWKSLLSVTQTAGVEGGTEFLQALVEETQDDIANGRELDIDWDNVIEATAKGVAGGGMLAGAGQGVSALRNAVAPEQAAGPVAESQGEPTQAENQDQPAEAVPGQENAVAQPDLQAEVQPEAQQSSPEAVQQQVEARKEEVLTELQKIAEEEGTNQVREFNSEDNQARFTALQQEYQTLEEGVLPTEVTPNNVPNNAPDTTNEEGPGISAAEPQASEAPTLDPQGQPAAQQDPVVAEQAKPDGERTGAPADKKPGYLGSRKEGIYTGNRHTSKTFARLTSDPERQFEELPDGTYAEISNELTELQSREAVAQAVAELGVAEGINNIVEEISNASIKDVPMPMRQFALSNAMSRAFAAGDNASFNKAYQSLQAHGTAAGQTLQAMKQSSGPDNLIAIQVAQQKQKLDNALNETVQGKTVKQRIKDTITEAAGVISPEMISKIADEVTKRLDEKSTQSKRRRQISRSKEDAKARFKAALKAQRGQTNANPFADPKVLKAALDYAYYSVLDGAYTFTDFSKEMVAGLGKEISPKLEELWNNQRVTKAMQKASNVKGVEKKIKTIQDGLAGVKQQDAFLEKLEALVVEAGLSKEDAKSVSKELSERLANKEKNRALSSAARTLASEQLPGTKKLTENKFRFYVEQGVLNDDILGPLLREKLTQKTTNTQGLKSSIKDAIVGYYEDSNATKARLESKLTEDFSLNANDAKAIAEEVYRRVEKEAKQDFSKIIARELGSVPLPKKPKDTFDRIARYLAMGVMDDQVHADLFAERYGIAQLSEADQAKAQQFIEEYNELMQDPTKKELQNRKVREMFDWMKTNKLMNEALHEKLTDYFYNSLLGRASTIINSLSGIAHTTIPEMIQSSLMTLGKKDGHKALGQAYKAMFVELGRMLPTFAQVISDGYSTMEFIDHKPRGKGWVERAVDANFKDLDNPQKARKAINYISSKTFRALLAMDAYLHYGLKEYNVKLEEFYKDGADALSTSKINEAELFTQVDKELAEMEKRKDKISIGYRMRRFHELRDSKRDKIIVENAIRAAKANMFTQAPEGHLGSAYRGMTKMLQINEGTSPAGAVIRATARFALFPILRVGFNFLNRGLDYTPIGFAKAAKGRTKDGKGDTRKYSQLERRNLMARASIGMALPTVVFFSMFEEDEEEGWKLKKDSWIDVTAAGPQDWKLHDQMGKDYMPYSVRFKVDGEWTDWYSYKYSPMGVVLAPMGAMRDALTINRLKKLADKKHPKVNGEELLARAVMASGIFFTQQSFAESVRRGQSILPSEQRLDSPDAWLEASGSAITRPMEAFIPGYVRDIGKWSDQINRNPQLDAQGAEQIIKNVPLLGRAIVEDHKTDVFGYPIIQNFDFPVLSMFDYIREAMDYRKDIPEWQFLQEREYVHISPFTLRSDNLEGYPIDEEIIEQKDEEYRKSAGLYFRELVKKNLDSLKGMNDVEVQMRMDKYRSSASRRAKRETLKDLSQEIRREKGRFNPIKFEDRSQ